MKARLPDLPTGVYRHHKGHHYLVLGYAENSTNDENEGAVMVVYVGLQLDGQPSPMRMRCREVDEFFGDVITPDGMMMPRFRYMGPTVLG